MYSIYKFYVLLICRAIISIFMYLQNFVIIVNIQKKTRETYREIRGREVDSWYWGLPINGEKCIEELLGVLCGGEN